MGKEWWTCSVGPTERDDLPDGSDFPMRQGVKRAFYDLTGEWPIVTSSGWGHEEDHSTRIATLEAKVERYRRFKEDVRCTLSLEESHMSEVISTLLHDLEALPEMKE
jgi:hypothetical protein